MRGSNEEQQFTPLVKKKPPKNKKQTNNNKCFVCNRTFHARAFGKPAIEIAATRVRVVLALALQILELPPGMSGIP
jgi:hypothetical protein